MDFSLSLSLSLSLTVSHEEKKRAKEETLSSALACDSGVHFAEIRHSSVATPVRVLNLKSSKIANVSENDSGNWIFSGAVNHSRKRRSVIKRRIFDCEISHRHSPVCFATLTGKREKKRASLILQKNLKKI